MHHGIDENNNTAALTVDQNTSWANGAKNFYLNHTTNSQDLNLPVNRLTRYPFTATHHESADIQSSDITTGITSTDTRPASAHVSPNLDIALAQFFLITESKSCCIASESSGNAGLYFNMPNKVASPLLPPKKNSASSV
jgi:hypothetical protein